MRVGVLGTGSVGRTIASRLVELGHDVMMGSRKARNDHATAWAAAAGDKASTGTFADAAAFGGLLVNATRGSASLDALDAAGAENLAGKVLIDVANPLDFSTGSLTLTVSSTDSLGEQIQRRFPDARVVKSLNTVNADIMVRPGTIAGSHTMFMAGNDAAAKADVRALLESFGWPPADLMDLGDLGAARGMEMYLQLWIRMMDAMGTWHFNVKVTPERP